MMVKFIALLIPAIIFLLVLELIRREKLTFKYAFGWMGLCLLAILFAVFDQWLFALSDFLGFELPSNFIFFALISFLFFLSLLITLFSCQQNRRNDAIAQKMALLEEEMNGIKNSLQEKR